MSRAALIESLQRQAAEDAETVWREARADAEKYRHEMAQALEQERTQSQQASAAAARQLEEAATVEAQHRAREISVNAAIALAERLRRLALAELARLGIEDAENFFVALARELPARAWQTVRVNPADQDRARRNFPGADVACDAGISGGMEVEAEAGRIRVSNTLEARLATAWPDVLPGLIANILAESSSHQPAA
jgi:vacuolar-type H+-ATPase subunit E/Vma4